MLDLMLAAFLETPTSQETQSGLAVGLKGRLHNFG